MKKLKINHLDQERNSQIKKTYKRKSYRPKPKFKFLLSLILGIIVLVLFALSPANTISKIEVKGNEHYKKDDIVMASDIVQGSNWFKIKEINKSDLHPFRNKKAENGIIKKCPYIKSVGIKYYIPGKVIISVEERKPAGIAPYLGAHLVIDIEGQVLDIVNNVQGFNVPAVKGLQFEHFEIGQVLSVKNHEAFQALKRVLEVIDASDKSNNKKLNNKIFSHIDYIDLSDLSKVHLYIDSRVLVNIGDYRDFDDYRISFLKQIYFTTLQKNEKGFLDFSKGNKPNFEPEK